MNAITNNHGISDEVLNFVNSELLKGNHWIAYNTVSYFFDKSDVFFFNNKDEAIDFAEGNISEYDNYRVVKAISFDEVLQQIPYGEQRLDSLTESIANEQKISKYIDKRERSLYERCRTNT